MTPLPRQQKTIVRKALRMVNSLSWCRGAKVPSNQGLTQVYATIRYDTPASAALEPLSATWRNMQHVTGKHALDIFWPWNMFRIQLSRKFCEMYIDDHRCTVLQRFWWRAVEFHDMQPNAQLSKRCCSTFNEINFQSTCKTPTLIKSNNPHLAGGEQLFGRL